jgi:hypothetical protein
MPTPAPTPCWSPGEVAFLADGEFAGMQVWVREVNSHTDRAVVSLRVFGERERFEIELAHLRKPLSLAARLVRATGSALLTLACGPLFSLLITAGTAFLRGHSLTVVLSWAEMGFAFALPIFGFCALLVFVGILFAERPAD